MLFETIFPLLFFCFVPATLGSDCKCGRSSVLTRIVGGTTAPDGAYPWLVSITRFTVYKNGQIEPKKCGGSIINSEYILTAAHCFEDYEDEASRVLTKLTYIAYGVNDNSQLFAQNLFRVSRGEIIYEDRLPKNVRQVDTVINHENYDPDEIVNDISLLHLSSPLDLGPKVSPICLEKEHRTYGELRVAGWGDLATGVYAGNELRHVTLNAVSDAECKSAWSADIKKQFCYEAGKRGTCQGDSGGPLVTLRGKVFTQVGLVSFGDEWCQAATKPDVATRVSYFYSWIMSKVKSGTWCSA